MQIKAKKKYQTYCILVHKVDRGKSYYMLENGCFAVDIRYLFKRNHLGMYEKRIETDMIRVTIKVEMPHVPFPGFWTTFENPKRSWK